MSDSDTGDGFQGKFSELRKGRLLIGARDRNRTGTPLMQESGGF
jgi:hypothetical protein